MPPVRTGGNIIGKRRRILIDNGDDADDVSELDVNEPPRNAS
jgi:hypothetical protein